VSIGNENIEENDSLVVDREEEKSQVRLECMHIYTVNAIEIGDC
jgi:hypothetical protein